jgi:hypothetical protein
MDRIDTFKSWPRLLLVLFLGFALLVAPAAAEDGLMNEGEPTDPEGALVVLGALDIDLDDHGIAPQPDAGEKEYDSWYEALLNLLRSLGLELAGR